MVQTGPTQSQHQRVTSCFFVKGYGSQNHEMLIWWKIGGTIQFNELSHGNKFLKSSSVCIHCTNSSNKLSPMELGQST